MKPDPAAMSIAQADAYVEAAEALAEAAQTFAEQVEGAASDGSFDPFAAEDMEGFNAADVALAEALAAFEATKAAQK